MKGGTTKVKINLNNELDFCIPVFIVKGLTKEFILGVDVLNKVNAVIDIGAKKITLANAYTFQIDVKSKEAYTVEIFEDTDSDCSIVYTGDTEDEMPDLIASDSDDEIASVRHPNDPDDMPGLLDESDNETESPG